MGEDLLSWEGRREREGKRERKGERVGRIDEGKEGERKRGREVGREGKTLPSFPFVS